MKSNKVMAVVLMLVIGMGSFTACSGSSGYIEENYETTTDEVLLAASTDLSPENDFYGYVNADELSELKIPLGDSVAGNTAKVEKLIDEQLRDMINDIVSSSDGYAEGSAEQIISDYYNQLMSYDYSNSDGNTVSFFKEALSSIDAVQSVEDYVSLMGRFYSEYGVHPILSVDINRSHVNTDVYSVLLECERMPLGSMLKSYNSSNEISSVNLVKNVLITFDAPEDIDEKCDDLIYMFVGIARASNLEIYSMDNIEKAAATQSLDLSEMQNILSNINLETFFKSCGATELPVEFETRDIGQLEKLNTYFTQDNLENLKNYTKITLIDTYAKYLPSEYENLRHTLANEPVSDDEYNMLVMNALDNLKGLVSDCYTVRYGDEETKEEVIELCENIRGSYRELISEADWISEEGRGLLLKKLNNTIFLVGGRDKKDTYPEYSGVIGDTPLEIEIKIHKANSSMEMKCINKNCPREEYALASTEVNACFSNENTVTVPYGIMNPPFFDKNASSAKNYGALGFVIAHEISHAFDSNCIKYDADGRFNPLWMPQEDINALEPKMQAVREYYDGYTIMDVYHVDGSLTLGENFADLGGMECVMKLVNTAAEKRELMESYASVWCQLEDNKSALMMLKRDTHCPNKVRVNAVLSSCDAFYEAYNIQEGDPMYVAPEDRVTRW